MKRIITLLLVAVFCPLISPAQSFIKLSGRVEDAKSGSPVPYAYVTLQGVALGTVTNGNGEFAIKIPDRHQEGSLIFSYVGYQSQTRKISDLLRQDEIVIDLQEDVRVLKEVVVVPRKQMSAKALMNKVLKGIPKNYSEKPVIMDGYYRETVTENGAFIKYADAVVKYYYAPYKRKRYKWKDYAYGYFSPFGSLSTFHTYAGARLHRIHFFQNTLKEDQAKILDSRSSDDLTKTKMHANIEGGPMGLMSKDRVKFQEAFTGKKMFKQYHFELGEVQDENGNWMYLITFHTKMTDNELSETQKKNTLKAYRKAQENKLLKGKIYIDQEDFAILKYEVSVPNELKKFFCSYKEMAIKHFDYKIEAEYSKLREKYYLKRLRQEDEFIYKDTINDVTTPYSAVVELNITGIKNENIQKFDPKEVFANSDANQLYDYALEYHPEFWMQYNEEHPEFSVPEQIRSDMESEKTMERQFKEKHQRNDSLPPPVAKKLPVVTKIHGDELIDDYAWLKDTSNPLQNDEVMEYIEAENRYADNYFIPLRRGQRELFEELTSRIEKNYESLPRKENGFLYYISYTGEDEYPVYYRVRDGESEKEILLDVNKMAAEKDYFYAMGIKVSPDTKMMSFYANTTGSDKWILKFKNLDSGEILPDSLANSGTMEWVDNNTIVYTEQEPKTNRTYRIREHKLFTAQSSDKVLVEEKDKTFAMNLSKSRSRKYIYAETQNSNTSEVYYLRLDQPRSKFRLAQKREAGHLYGIADYKDKFYMHSNKSAINFKVLEIDTTEIRGGRWKPFIPHKKDVLINGFLKFDNYTVVREKSNVQNRIRVIEDKSGKDHYIKFKEDIYNVFLGYNPEENTDSLQISYESFKTPRTTYNYHMGTKKSRVVKKQKIPNLPFTARSKFTKVKRVWAPSEDGTLVPITLLYLDLAISKNRKNKRLYMTSYGSYGSGTDIGFNQDLFSLVDRYFVVALVHVRGGDDMGRQWYEDGKLLKKKNTFADFISSAEYLIREGYADRGSIVAEGASAGGLLMGAIANMRPDLFHLIILEKPFVDVLNTMLDDKLPLTTLEYEEWGPPKIKKVYKYIKSYSPYDNLVAQDYPNMLLTTGLNDTRVGYWEPAKMVAKLRDLKTDDNLILLKTDPYSGHAGGSGRYTYYRDLAYKYAIIFDLFKTGEKEAAPVSSDDP
jgi:protease II